MHDGNENRGASDDRPQDGMGRDAAHGRLDGMSGGSYGRSTGRAGEGSDALDDPSSSEAPDGGRTDRDVDVPRGTDEQSGDRGRQAAPSAGDRDAYDGVIDLDARHESGRRDSMR